jgi:hypothetical protein
MEILAASGISLECRTNEAGDVQDSALGGGVGEGEGGGEGEGVGGGGGRGVGGGVGAGVGGGVGENKRIAGVPMRLPTHRSAPLARAGARVWAWSRVGAMAEAMAGRRPWTWAVAVAEAGVWGRARSRARSRSAASAWAQARTSGSQFFG